MFNASIAMVLVAIATIALGLKLSHVGRRPKSYPPGPPTLPLIGNLHLMPTERPWLQFQQWAQEYGPIYSLILGTKTYVVLSSPETVKDLLDKKSNIYSSRPELYMGQEIASGGLRLVMLQYGPLWRTHHKMIHNILNIKAATTYVPYQDLESKQMLLGLLNQPESFVEEIQRFTISLTTQMIYGFRTSAIGDPKVNQFFECFENWGKLVEGAASQFLDLYPVLRRLPPTLRPQFRYAQRLHKVELGLYKGHWMEAKKNLQNGTGMPCFANDLLRVQEKAGMNNSEAGYLCGSLLEAGSDTTSSILIGFVQAMLVFPEVQRQAQAVIDSVVGPDRLPTVDDAAQMPYIWCCVKEAIRWMPTTVLGAPHANTQDDVYKGFSIPAGTTIINNVWALQMDPERNPDPRRFNPDRFVDDIESEFVSATAADPSKRNNYIFGAGRRLCQGMHIAERSLFLGVSRLIWAFEFGRPIDKVTGQPKPLPDIENLVGGLTIKPADFEVKITPRSAEKARIIRETWKECDENLLDVDTKQWKKIPEGMAFTTLMVDKLDG